MLLVRHHLGVYGGRICVLWRQLYVGVYLRLGRALEACTILERVIVFFVVDA